ncbi:MAG: hypothetical protein ACE5GL_11560 [Calditrichia bacterium]
MEKKLPSNKNVWVTIFILMVALFFYKDSEGQEFTLFLDISTNMGNENWDLTLGMSPYATDGYDIGIDAQGLPPPPWCCWNSFL